MWRRVRGVIMMDILPKVDRIYIAGALNGETCDIYIENLSRMTKYANKIMRMNNAVFSPGNDFIQGIVDGTLQYDDYFNNSQELLRVSDAMFVVPHSENSPGVARERIVAEQLGIPVFDDIDSLVEFNNRPKILTITGESGTGKTSIAEYIESVYAVPMIQSHTDRPKRYPDEIGHTFHTAEEYDKFNQKDMIAWTNFGSNRYCCLKEDVEQDNTYVIDEKGLLMLTNLHKASYNVFSLRVKRDMALRSKDISYERLCRDLDAFWLPDSFYDAVIENDGTEEELYDMVDKVFGTFFL
jgi:guanylate kinase